MSDEEPMLERVANSITSPTKPEPIPFAEFLESVPPSQWRPIKDLWHYKPTRVGTASSLVLHAPELQLHCTTDICNGLRFFRFNSGEIEYRGAVLQTYVSYVCSNCRKADKTYAIQAVREKDQSGRCYKYGESPAYGPQTPARLMRLFGTDRLLFLKGRRCENQGLGIGAFVYYRRVVENHKDRILDEIIRVSSKIGAPEEMLETLKAAKGENQFSRAMDSVKNAIPQALLINGANPLTLLHSALSVGLHAQSDEQCLELAHDVRVVLVELAERLGQALNDEAELNTAVTRLMNVRQRKEEDTASGKAVTSGELGS